jgi:hypothetical protein
VILDLFADNDELFAKLKGGNPGYDVIVPTNDNLERMIKANMDRWRWLARDMGLQYLIINVPEQELRLTVNNRIIRTYRAIVGKPGKTATPQLLPTMLRLNTTAAPQVLRTSGHKAPCQPMCNRNQF